MEYRWIEDIGEFKDAARGWDDALLASGEDNPFLLSDFIITWWKYYGADLGLQIFVVYDKTDVVGGVPLFRNKTGRLEHIGGIHANYTEVLAIRDAAVIWELFLKALSARKDWRLTQFRRYRKRALDQGKDKLCKDAGSNGILLDISSRESSYMILVPQDFQGYLARLPKKLRYYVKRSLEELSKLGEVRLEHVSDRKEIDRLSDLFIGFSRRSFKDRGRESAFEDKTSCGFFKESIIKFFDRGYLDANVLKLNGNVIAIHFGYSMGNNLNYILPSFDIEFAKFNPGHLMIYKLIEAASRRKNDFVDLYTGRQFYKEQWSDHREDVYLVELRPDTVFNRFARLAARSMRNSTIFIKLKTILKRHRLLFNFGSRIKKLLGRYF